MKGRAGGEREKTMRQLVLCNDEVAGAEGSDRAEVIPLHEEAEEPRPARGMRRAGWLLVACGLALLPWLYVLATGLPPPRPRRTGRSPGSGSTRWRRSA